jgi:hypothetical protein
MRWIRRVDGMGLVKPWRCVWSGGDWQTAADLWHSEPWSGLVLLSERTLAFHAFLMLPSSLLNLFGVLGRSRGTEEKR